MSHASSRPSFLEFDAKIVLLGNSGVGKTSLVYRYVQGTYELNQASTIGASFMTKRMRIDDCHVKLQIWDTAGQERFKSMAPMYYRNSNAAILVYDITNRESFDAIKHWVRELNANIKGDIVIAIAGNKSDLTDGRVVPNDVAREYANSIDAIFYETSAKDDKGVETLFLEVTKKLIEGSGLRKPNYPSSNDAIDLNSLQPKRNTGTKCCMN